MLDILPPGLRGRLEPYSECFATPNNSVSTNPSVVQSNPSAGRPARRRNVIHPVIR